MIAELKARGYSAVAGDFSTGRPDQSAMLLRSPTHSQLIGKRYSLERGPAVFQSMVQLWNSSFGETRKPPGLPRPVEYIEDCRTLIMEYIPGKPFAELFPNEAPFEQSVMLLVDLHESNARPVKRRDQPGILRSIRRKALSVKDYDQEYVPSFLKLAEQLAEASVPDSELVPSHGDFSPRNLLVASDRVALIDWDRFQWADPARDVSYLGLWFWMFGLRRGFPDWSASKKIIAQYQELRPASSVAERIHFHNAAGLVRIAHSILQFWPDDKKWIPQILAEASAQISKRTKC